MAMHSSVFLAGCEITAFLVGLAGCILLKISNTQHGPYMDEIFHIRQASKYCEGEFSEWDPMITTLPGLYLVSTGIFQLVARLTDFKMGEICVTFWLRCINIGFSMGNFVLLLLLIWHIHGKSKEFDKCRGLLTATALTLLPTLYFFTFLYYTDSGSTFFVLLTILLGRHHKHKLAAVSGIGAILFRQTNIIWVFFTAGLAVAHLIMDLILLKKKDISDVTIQSSGFLKIVLATLWNELRNWTPGFRLLLRNIITQCYAYILVGMAFVVFVIMNNGIVVGARTAHQACLHIPQIFYFLGFTLAFSFMHLISIHKIIACLLWIWRHKLTTVLLVIFAAVCVWKLTYAHPYLLADNRHYTFYVWSRIYRRHDLVKFALIPVYVYAAWSVCYELRFKNIIWKMLFAVCTCICLVPQQLMEFRYFIIPYLILRLNMNIAAYWKIILELIVYGAVNALTIYIFVERPFLWPDSENKQRFMW
ncbi:dol-P-Glc:Glc(2)Man(9)GlcNAc(2)-PP-Dol alpha-1,2-glucosyltransferase-like [Tubulanus polymorphus]|uniref:dol-P-Glc:Glc(2)Man(9)GlcNAc(2)-PP-Dol alpha-1,2-glucosyltransferase-like n=1 Tax=Tubulanus polymorphus TaxID=672921 RepID=UPI003DA54AE5